MGKAEISPISPDHLPKFQIGGDHQPLPIGVPNGVNKATLIDNISRIRNGLNNKRIEFFTGVKAPEEEPAPPTLNGAESTNGHVSDVDEEAEQEGLPSGIRYLENQVAGHLVGKSVGMLKEGSLVMKPIIKPHLGEREISFYEDLNKNCDDHILTLKELTPKYYGTKRVQIDEHEYNCLVLDNLVRNLKEACIMDIKIGRRTWDPLASADKVAAEESKYRDSKRDLGFCVPGFIVHRIVDGRVTRFGKEYGKKITRDSVKDVLKNFLNSEAGLSRDLILQLLVELWKIQRWARKQKKLRLYSSSILLIYDARALKHCLHSCSSPRVQSKPLPPLPPRPSCLYKPMSVMRLNEDRICTGFSGQFTKDGPILQANRSIRYLPSCLRRERKQKSTDKITKLKRAHSFQHNFDKDLQCLKKDYAEILEDLVDEDKAKVWATAKMIDFAHVFPAESNDLDRNYLAGVESLVRIFEEFLAETAS